MDKHSSLLHKFGNYGRKKFYEIGPRSGNGTETDREPDSGPSGLVTSSGAEPVGGDSQKSTAVGEETNPSQTRERAEGTLILTLFGLRPGSNRFLLPVSSMGSEAVFLVVCDPSMNEL